MTAKNAFISLDPNLIDYNVSEQRPENPFQALMQTIPFENTQESVQELQVLREAVAECVEKLSKKDRIIIDAVNSEMLSLRELGVRLGVHNVVAMRMRNKAYERLQKIMLKNEVIRRRFYLDNPDE